MGADRRYASPVVVWIVDKRPSEIAGDVQAAVVVAVVHVSVKWIRPCARDFERERYSSRQDAPVLVEES